MAHNPQVETDRGTRERTYHASLLATGTVWRGEVNFTSPLHQLLHRSLHSREKSKSHSNHSDRSFAKGGIARGRGTL
jgi:hypothetical protein